MEKKLYKNRKFKESIENFDKIKNLQTAVDPVTANAIEFSKRKDKIAKQAEKGKGKEFDGAPKQPHPKKVEMPKSTLDESLFEDVESNECLSESKSLTEDSYGWSVDPMHIQDAYDEACEYFGKEDLDAQIVDCISQDELKDCLDFIFRMNDFRECSYLEESCNKKSSNKKLNEANWEYNLKCGKELRDAIDAENYEAVQECLIKAWKELAEQFPDDVDDSYLEDVEFLDVIPDEETSQEDIEDEFNYELDKLYDFCDGFKVWVSLDESNSFSESCNKQDIGNRSLTEAPIYDLDTQYDNRQGFYGKATVDDDNNGNPILYSYDTPVCELKDGKVILMDKWDSSITTLRHVKEFLKQNGFEASSLGQLKRDYT